MNIPPDIQREIDLSVELSRYSLLYKDVMVTLKASDVDVEMSEYLIGKRLVENDGVPCTIIGFHCDVFVIGVNGRRQIFTRLEIQWPLLKLPYSYIRKYAKA